MRCRHCGQHITFDYSGIREWVHSSTGKVECIIDGAEAGTQADPDE